MTDRTAQDRHEWFTAAARSLADHSRPGTLARKSAGCVFVAFTSSRTTNGARKILRDVKPEYVRHAAEVLLDHLTTPENHR